MIVNGRDLKPDNCLLDMEGHIHLTDFNIAVKYKVNVPLASVAGSIAYMAPEVIAKKEYYSSPDWWSLGVMFFEFVAGKRPFKGKNNDELKFAILNDQPFFPDGCEKDTSQNCKQVILGLLEKEPNNRLGHGDNFSKLVKHPLFSSINWEFLEKKEITPIFIPDQKHTNFDMTHELEELLLEDNPLRVKKRSQNRNFNHLPGGAYGETAKQLKDLEETFKVFNFEKKDNKITDEIESEKGNLRKASGNI
jgi:serine/threonine kinase 32